VPAPTGNHLFVSQRTHPSTALAGHANTPTFITGTPRNGYAYVTRCANDGATYDLQYLVGGAVQTVTVGGTPMQAIPLTSGWNTGEYPWVIGTGQTWRLRRNGLVIATVTGPDVVSNPTRPNWFEFCGGASAA
jgi:hypothetical protein